MLRHDQKYAIVIELEGNILESIKKAQQLLAKEFGISYIADSSPCAHITLESDFIINDFNSLKKALGHLGRELSRFEVQAVGLGVFIANTPVVHIRWRNSISLLSLKRRLEVLMQSLCVSNVVANYSVDMDWLAKTTLAYADTTYENLSAVILSLQNFDFDLTTLVSGVSIYSYIPGKEERNIAVIPF